MQKTITQQMLLEEKQTRAFVFQHHLMEKRPPAEQDKQDGANLPIGRISKSGSDKKNTEPSEEERRKILVGTIRTNDGASKESTYKEGASNKQDAAIVKKNIAGKGHTNAPSDEKTRIQPGKVLSTAAIDTSSPKKEARAKKKGSGPDERILPEDFKPTPYSVIIGRGKESRDHTIGNHRLRVLVSQHLPQYANAVNRSTMSKLVSSVVAQVREACSKDAQDGGGTSSGGAFVKLGKEDGRWYEVSDAVAREKVGYTFRDMLGDRYRSSSQFKVARKRQLRGEDEVYGEQEQRRQPQEFPNPEADQTGKNMALFAPRNSTVEQQDASLPQVGGEESSSTKKWPQSISPHQIPPPGFILLDGANTPHDFFGTSSSGSNSSPTLNNHAREDMEVSQQVDSADRHQHQPQHRQQSHETTAKTTGSLQIDEVHSSSDEALANPKDASKQTREGL